MSTRIDTRLSAGELPIRLLLLIFGSALTALLMMAIVLKQSPEYRKELLPENYSLYFIQAPHMKAGALTIQSGLDEFTGNQPKPMSARAASGLALGFLLSYVIGPVLLLQWLRRRLIGERDKLPRLSTIAGVFLTAFWIFLAIPGFIGQFQVSARLKTAQSVQMAKDDIINALTLVANAAQQYRILPKRLGGGGGSFEGFVVPAEFAGSSDATSIDSHSAGIPLIQFPMRITAVARHDEIEFSAVPLVNPRSRFTDEPLQPIPDARVRTTLQKDGFMWNWVYSGLFE